MKAMRLRTDRHTAARNRSLGAVGEQLAEDVLRRNGFANIENLNSTISNFPYADLYAEREGKRYVISVKTRNKYQADGRLNARYNLMPNHADKAERLTSATAAWIAISFEPTVYSAYFGLLSQLNGKLAIAMGPQAVVRYECLASCEPHHLDYASLQNIYDVVAQPDIREENETIPQARCYRCNAIDVSGGVAITVSQGSTFTLRLCGACASERNAWELLHDAYCSAHDGLLHTGQDA